MKRFYLNQQQEDELVKELAEVGRQLIHVDFSNPANDHQNIRHHAYLRGRFDQCQQLLADDYVNPLDEAKPEGAA